MTMTMAPTEDETADSDPTSQASERLHAVAPETGGSLLTNWVLLPEWMAAIGLSESDLERVVEWVESGAWPARTVGGAVWLPLPVWGQPPPEYVTVREWAAKNGVSGAHGYALIRRGALGPAWVQPISHYSHYYVADWAQTREVARRTRKGQRRREA